LREKQLIIYATASSCLSTRGPACQTVRPLAAKNCKKCTISCEKGYGAVTIDFNAPDLARRIDQLIQSDLDQLPFGVILLAREGIVLVYSQTEVRQSG